MTSGRFAIIILLLLTAVLFSGGCATSDEDTELPWNTPQQWEGTPYVPGLDGR